MTEEAAAGGRRVAYLGPAGSYTQEAVRQHFGEVVSEVACGTIEAVFEEVEGGGVDCGVVPVENSNEGTVTRTLDSFVESRLCIVAEVLVEVNHCLLAPEGLPESQLARVYSHPQALAQCRRWLAKTVPGANLVETSSTAEAARRARAEQNAGAVASASAGRQHKLAILHTQIQDRIDNVTRFLVLRREPLSALSPGDHKTSLLLVLRDVPGALYKALEPLSRAEVNLSKIESRPLGRRAWEYVFFLELAGSAEAPGIATALKEVALLCKQFKVLGVYGQAS